MEPVDKNLAKKLLSISAIKLHPENPFVWASGWNSPIYTDNRKTLSYPDVRTFIKIELCRLIEEEFGTVEAIAGVATGEIAQGALVADELDLPYVYVRSSPKNHGLENLIEGNLKPGQKVVVIEDLISTGGSSLKAVEAIRKAGCEVIGMVAIFTYGFPTSPYAYCAGNPIRFTDPTGCMIGSIDEDNLGEVAKDLLLTFSDKVFKEFQKLIEIDQETLTIKQISNESINKAFNDVDLNQDQKALVDIVVNTINSDDIHIVEYINDEKVLSSTAKDAFLPGYMEGPIAPYMEQILEANNGLPVWLITNDGGSGSTVETANGSYSLIFKEGDHPFGRFVTTGHEIFGHGRPLMLGLKEVEQQHQEAIRMENLILRVNGINFINNGKNHGTRNTNFDYRALPSFK